MATFVKFNEFVAYLATKNHELETDALKFALTNTAPTAATDTSFDPITKHPPPAAANGYTAEGHLVTKTATSVGGVFTLVCTTDVVITATAGGIGPFRYVILYNAANGYLIAYWDYGSSITLASGETFTIDVTASLLTIT